MKICNSPLPHIPSLLRQSLKCLSSLWLSTLILLSQSHYSCSSPPFLALPLKTSLIPPQAHPRPPLRIPFRHQVALTVSVAVGNPSQNVTVVLDTGSELPWLRCKNPGFDPTRSSSYSPFSCSSPTCTTRTHNLTAPVTCDPNHLCRATLSYADGSTAEGTLASDTLRVGGSDVPGTVFGCMDSGSSSNPEDSRNAGLLGMNRGALSLISQLGLRTFSYCIPDRDHSGVLYLGERANMSWVPHLSYTPLVTMSGPLRLPYYDRSAYTVRLEGIKVGGKLLPLPKSVFVPDHTGAGQTLVDTGTQFTHLTGPVYAALRSEFLNRTSGILRVLKDPGFVFQRTMDLCYLVPAGQAKLPPLPAVSLVFESAEMVVDGGERLLYPAGERRGKDSVYCFGFGNSDLLPAESILIGHQQQQNMWMEMDLRRGRMGLAQAQCNRAAKELGVGLF